MIDMLIPNQALFIFQSGCMDIMDNGSYLRPESEPLKGEFA